MNRVGPLLILFAALLAGSCGGDHERRRGPFDVQVGISRHAGPTPLVTRFSARARNAAGDVLYRWRFDDGTTSKDQNPTHRFSMAGYYTVILDARDEAGHKKRLTFLLGAWARKDWAEARWGFGGWDERTGEWRGDTAVRRQQRRTRARRARIAAELRKHARQ